MVAGYPATGKTYFCERLTQRYDRLEVLSPDRFREALWDRIGFRSPAEKEALVERGWRAYYSALAEAMDREAAIVSDYPFSAKQHDRLSELVTAHDYEAVTIRLTGDLQVLYERSLARDLDPSRNLAHLVNSYQGPASSVDRSKADGLLTWEIFQSRCLTRGYDSFCLGRLIEVDVTDYSRIDYQAIFATLDDLLR
ncbi:MAG: AAA family ATPase [Propionicimonas sp.]